MVRLYGLGEGDDDLTETPGMAPDFLTTQSISALAGFGGAILGALVSGLIQVFLHGKRIAADGNLAERKFDFDKRLAEKKFAQEKAQLVFRRRFELAEGILSDA